MFVFVELDVAIFAQTTFLEVLSLLIQDIFDGDAFVGENLRRCQRPISFFVSGSRRTFRWSEIRCLFLQPGQVIRVVPK